MQGVYSQGAGNYVNAGSAILYSFYNGGTNGSYSLGIMSDSVYGTLAGVNTDIQLTTAWAVNAGYEHFWTKQFQTSVFGGYIATSYNSTANSLLCANTGIVAAGFTGTCNNNWAVWDVGIRPQYNIDSQTYFGGEVLYEKLLTANKGVVGTVTGSGTQPTTVRTFADQDAFMVRGRIHRNFYP